MKNYIIILEPEKSVAEMVGVYRERMIGTRLVDALPPHASVVRRFMLKDGHTETELVEYFKTLAYPKFMVDFDGAKYLGDAFVMVGKSEDVVRVHDELTNKLSGMISLTNPEWDGGNFVVHLTLLRGAGYAEAPKLEKAVFDNLCLYEIDASGQRLYANKLATIVLL